MKLSQGSSESSSVKPTEIADKNNVKGSANDKMKASNFTATLLRIGSWEVLPMNFCLSYSGSISIKMMSLLFILFVKYYCISKVELSEFTCSKFSRWDFAFFTLKLTAI